MRYKSKNGAADSVPLNNNTSEAIYLIVRFMAGKSGQDY
jgi:hypothetical protein